jgi:hypothetical protein
MDAVVFNSINFIGYPDSSSFIQLCNLVQPQLNAFSKSGKIIFYIVGVGLCVVAVAAAYAANSVAVFFEILTLNIVLVGVPVGSLKLSRKQAIKIQCVNYDKSIQKEPRTGSISTSGILFKIADGKTELQWTHFDRLVETDGAFALCKQSRMVDAFSCSMFESKESFEAALKIALEKVKIIH